MVIALIGNQNSGKTTLFNQLTGSNQHVGNFPGVTVEGKSGQIKRIKDQKVTVLDLPGIYSLSPYSSDEIITRDILMSGEVDAIINIVDATNIERNLYLTMQLLQLNMPMVLALNMMDEVRNNGGSIDVNGLSKELGINAIPISAVKNEGVAELVEITIEVAKNKIKPQNSDSCFGACHRAIHSVMIMIEDHANKINIPAKFAAIKLIEGDEALTKKLVLSDNEIDMINHTIQELETETSLDRYSAIASMRYKYIEEFCLQYVKKPVASKEYLRSVKIDKILTHKYFGLPIFFLVMFFIFYLTFGVLGGALSELLLSLIDLLSNWVETGLIAYGINPVVLSLLIDGVFAGVGSVISFLPIIIILFFFLSLLEDSGYMTRVAFIMDRLLRKIGLSGRSFVPMLLGFGCTVPAVLSTRTLSSDRDRKMTIFLLSFFSCSAKLPIYAVFAYVFFPTFAPFVMIFLYVFGILIGIIASLIMKKTRFKGQPIPFVMELPNYRIPSVKTTILLMWDKAKDFLQRAFSVIFIATIVVWFLQSFDFQLNFILDKEDIASSMLASIARFIAPIFRPIGFGDWKAVTALIAGFSAKEAVISTLAVLTGSKVNQLGESLRMLFTPLSAFSFLIFVLLYTPCIAAIRAVKMELKSTKATLVLVFLQLAIAYVISLVIYQIGLLF